MRQMFSGTFSLCPLLEGSFPLVSSGVFCAVFAMGGQASLEGQGRGRRGRWENSPAVTERHCEESHADAHACTRTRPAPTFRDSAGASAGTDGSREAPRHIPLLNYPPYCVSLLPHAALSPASLLGEGAGCLADLSELCRRQVPSTLVPPAVTALLGSGCVCGVGVSFTIKATFDDHPPPPNTSKSSAGLRAAGWGWGEHSL